MSRLPEPPPADEPGTDPLSALTGTLHQLAGGHPDREHLLGQGLADLAELQRELAATTASLHTAEEVVIRQKALLETATEMIEEARRWARSLWDDEPAQEEPVVLNEPEFAPPWLTADGPRHSAPRPRRPGGVEPSVATNELRLAALDRLIADVEAEWGSFTAEELADAAQRLHNHAHREE